MGKAKALTVLLVVVLAYQPFGAVAQTPGENAARIKVQAEQRAPGEAQTLSGNVFLVKAYSDLPLHFSKKAFKTELQRRLELQFRFSLAIQILALLLGILALIVISIRRRRSAFDHKK
jgi:hypothetical protein